jgi:uncharacterized protein YraI
VKWLLLTGWILGALILTINSLVLVQVLRTHDPVGIAVSESDVAKPAAGPTQTSTSPREMLETVQIIDKSPASEEALSEEPNKSDDEWAEVISAVNLRAGPSAGERRLQTYQPGTMLRIISSESGWVQVFNPETSESGWIYSEYLSSTPWALTEANSTEMAATLEANSDEAIKATGAEQTEGQAATRSESPEVEQSEEREGATESAPLPETAASEAGDDWTEVRSAVNLRAGASTSAPVMRTIRPGTSLRILDRDSGWIKVFDPEVSETGWVYSDYLAMGERSHSHHAQARQWNTEIQTNHGERQRPGDGDARAQSRSDAERTPAEARNSRSSAHDALTDDDVPQLNRTAEERHARRRHFPPDEFEDFEDRGPIAFWEELLSPPWERPW